jgi:hypothetical protein
MCLFAKAISYGGNYKQGMAYIKCGSFPENAEDAPASEDGLTLLKYQNY